MARNSGNFRRPGSGYGIVGNLNDFQRRGRSGPIKSLEVRELFDRRGGVFSAHRLLYRLEKNVQGQGGHVSVEVLEGTADVGAAVTGLAVLDCKVLSRW